MAKDGDGEKEETCRSDGEWKVPLEALSKRIAVLEGRMTALEAKLEAAVKEAQKQVPWLFR